MCDTVIHLNNTVIHLSNTIKYIKVTQLHTPTHLNHAVIHLDKHNTMYTVTHFSVPVINQNIQYSGKSKRIECSSPVEDDDGCGAIGVPEGGGVQLLRVLGGEAQLRRPLLHELGEVAHRVEHRVLVELVCFLYESQSN